MTPLLFDYPISIAIIYCGDSSTLDTVISIEKAMKKRGHVVRKVKVNRNNWRKAIKTPGDVVFNLVEDDGWQLWKKVGIALSDMGRVQVGYDRKTYDFSITKSGMKKTLIRKGIRTPKFRVFTKKSSFKTRMEYPVILKPGAEHASVGISQDSVVIDQEEMNERLKYLFSKFSGDVLAEEYVEGRELHITVIGNKKRTIMLPVCEIVFSGEFEDNWNVYTYDAKWKQDSWEYWNNETVCPVKLPVKVIDDIEKQVVKAFRAFNIPDVARFDVRLNDKGLAYIIDVNVFPSLQDGEADEAWASAQALGWSYEEFIETIVAISYKRGYGKLPKSIRERQLLLSAGF